MSINSLAIEKPANPQRGLAKRSVGKNIVWPSGVEARYDISPPTRWRWEKAHKLPPRDVFIGGIPSGWKPETLDAADRGQIIHTS